MYSPGPARGNECGAPAAGAPAAGAWPRAKSRLVVVPAGEVGARRQSDEARARELAAARFLDRSLRHLATHESRCRRVLGDLVSVLRRRQTFFRLGFVRLSDYTRERLGISGSEAETAARVAAGLRGLPAIARAFDAGEISFTKVRILVRAASAESEERWLARARGETVRELERRVQGEGGAAADRSPEGAGTEETGTADATDARLPVAAPFAAIGELAAIREDDGIEIDGEPRVRFRAACPGWSWLFFRRAVDRARRMAGADVPVWQAIEELCAAALAAVPGALSAEEKVATESPGECAPGERGARRAGGVEMPRATHGVHGIPTAGGVEMPDAACGRHRPATAGEAGGEMPEPTEDVAAFLGLEKGALADILPGDLAPLAAGADDAHPLELDRRLREVVRELRRIDWKIGRLLSILFASRLERCLGVVSQEDYARERLGISVRKARQLIALDRLAGEVPRFGQEYRDGRISWVQASVLRPVLTGAGAARADAWLERAGQVMVRRLSDEVGWVLERRAARPGAAGLEPPPLGAVLEPEPVEVPGDGVQMRADAVIEFSGPASVVATFRRLILAWSEPGEPSWKGLVRLLAHVLRGWRSPRRRFGRILSRDGYRCLAPGCTSRRNLEVHHMLFRSAGGGDEETNLGTLCQGHHLHGIHEGRVRATGRAPDALVWELGVGLRPGGHPFLRLRGEV